MSNISILLVAVLLIATGGAVQLRNVLTGQCLTMATGTSYIKSVTMATCDKGKIEQEWESVPIEGAPGYRMLRNMYNLADAHCLDNGDLRQAIYAHGCNGGDFQSWSTGRVFKNPTLNTCVQGDHVNGSAQHGPCTPHWRGQRWREVKSL